MIAAGKIQAVPDQEVPKPMVGDDRLTVVPVPFSENSVVERVGTTRDQLIDFAFYLIDLFYFQPVSENAQNRT